MFPGLLIKTILVNSYMWCSYANSHPQQVFPAKKGTKRRFRDSRFIRRAPALASKTMTSAVPSYLAT